MRKLIILLPLIAIFVYPVKLSAQDFTIQVDTLRDYRLHLPTNYSSEKSYPLLFALHGGFGTSERMEEETNFSDKADQEGFIVVYPQAIGTTRSWNTGSCCGWAFNNDVDDILFFETLIDELSSNYSVDINRVYATGFSSGAMMSYALACKLSDKIAAIAPVASSMIIDVCEPNCTAVPILHLHAAPDESALFYGGYSDNPLLQFYYPPVDSVMRAWAMKKNCNTTIDSTIMSNGTKVYKWSDCEQNNYQEMWLADDGGHKWPGTSGVSPLSRDRATQDFDATEVVWDFLSQFQKECITSALENQIENVEIQIYPNPVLEYLNVSNITNQTIINIYDIHGKQVLNNLRTNRIFVGNLNRGLYFLSVRNSKNMISFKFVKE
ncbi:MAG: T9SS type A sorting domain-containing protein [Bacteroidota bacterium]